MPNLDTKDISDFHKNLWIFDFDKTAWKLEFEIDIGI